LRRLGSDASRMETRYTGILGAFLTGLTEGNGSLNPAELSRLVAGSSGDRLHAQFRYKPDMIANLAQITVVYPIFDLRGQGAERVRTWTHDQTLARERYRIVIASADASHEGEVLELLGPGDELVRLTSANDAALWNAGARRAGTTWLVFTEGHCLAEPGCLDAVARWIGAKPSVAAGTFNVGHDESFLLGRLHRRWFELIHARWREPGEWTRLTRSGFAIRADVFEAVGGFEPDYGQFAPALLSARLHARGIRIGAVPGAAVVHVDSEGMRDHHADTANYARGEIEARSRIDSVFFERYFGHSSTWANQLRHERGVLRRMARAVVAAAKARPKRIVELAALLRPLALAMVKGTAPRVALHRLAVALDEFAVQRLPLPAAWRWARFLRAHARVVHLAQLEWIRHRKSHPALPLGPDRLPIERLVPDTVTGVHAIEEHGGRRFRWTEPIALFRLAASEGEHELRIETGGIRGDPLAFVIAVIFQGRLLPRELLASDDEGTLLLRLPARRTASESWLVIVCSALAPASPDTRLLGLPILSISSVPSCTQARTGRVAV
jgi:hypothetical protein